MSGALNREYAASKIGATRKKAFTAQAVSTIQLVSYSTGVFTPSSFAVAVSKKAYVRQDDSSNDPADMTLEMELAATSVWRVDVDQPSERYLHVEGVSASGYVKVTELTRTSGTTSDLDA